MQDYLVSLADVTSVVVSHDSGFLDAVCTDIVHYEKDKKLKHYKVGALPLPLHLRMPAAAVMKFMVPCHICHRACQGRGRSCSGNRRLTAGQSQLVAC